MANVITFPAQVTVPVERFASGTDGLLVSSSQDLEAFDIRAKLNSVCEDIELLKLTFESLKRSTDLSAWCQDWPSRSFGKEERGSKNQTQRSRG